MGGPYRGRPRVDVKLKAEIRESDDIFYRKSEALRKLCGLVESACTSDSETNCD